MNNYIVVAYYTTNSIYEKYAMKLKASLLQVQIPFYIHPVLTKGSWKKNTSFKPSFILEMMDKFPDKNIVYTDADSEFLSSPVLFSTLCSSCQSIAVNYLDHVKHKKIKREPELLSGTMFISNNVETKNQIKQWQQKCINNPNTWDQKVLQSIIGTTATLLPDEYCYIFDYKYAQQLNPVVIHYQASREVRRQQTTK